MRRLFTVSLLQGLLLCCAVVQADDTEVYNTATETKSNILFIMDNSGSMREKVAGTIVNNGNEITVSYPIIDPVDDAEQRLDKPWINITSSDLEMTKEVFSRDNSREQVVGLRFRNIQIPKGVEITEAFIQFTADDDSNDLSSVPTELRIRIEKSDDAIKFDHYDRNIRNRNLYRERVLWNPPPWTTVNEKSDAQKTPNLKSLVQKVIDRNGWEEGHAMVFVIDGTGRRVAASYNNSSFSHNEGAPVLTIKYLPTGEKTRLQVMQGALKQVLENAPNNLNIGIMNYGNSRSTYDYRRNYPSGIKFPAKPLDSLVRPVIEESLRLNGVVDWSMNAGNPEPSAGATVRQYITEIAESWEARGATPIVDALYEAALYFRGDNLYYGFVVASDRAAAHPATYTQQTPNLIEPIIKTREIDRCGGTFTGTITDTAFNDRLTRWINSGGASPGGWICPVDPANPTETGMSTQNCVDNRYDCTQSDPYRLCNDWVDPVTHQECTGVNEDGIPTGCTTITDQPGYCRNDDWGDWVRDASCKFKYCRATYVPLSAPKYKSPTIAACQTNNIILMSDGKPEYTTDRKPFAYNKIRELMNNANCEQNPFGFKAGTCGKELTHYLAENDFNLAMGRDQIVNTYVIGFSSGISANAENYLKSLVTVEDDPETPDREGYYSALNEEELANAFQQTLEMIAQESRSLASPGYSVNVKSGLEHEDDIYIPVFDKTSGGAWSGNLKKFKLVNDNGHRFIRGKVTKEGDSDANGYIDAMTELGLFKDSAWDEWSQSEIPDGNDVAKGGAASLLTRPDLRKLYTNMDADLTRPTSQIAVSNNSLDASLFFDAGELSLDSAGAAEYRETLINYIRGWLGGEYDPSKTDINDRGTPRLHMGDMLHTEPVVITYDNEHQYIFAATNEGYLHAFDTRTGEEQWAFMPKELLKNIHKQFVGTGKHVYGIDGPISYFKDKRTNKVYLYFGLRRGGRAYYALDITDPLKPRFLWKKDNNDLGNSLGQSWSMPYIASVNYNNQKIPAVIITGGHDPATDYEPYEDDQSVTTDVQASMGNNIFILNAVTGEKLWDMRSKLGNIVKHSIPGGARILDVDRNGLLDRLYFADTGGNVWRLDLDESLGNQSKLKKIATLGGEGSSSRKFYNEPDVAMLQANGRTIFTVSVGSGIRPHPLNDVIDDKMFILLDKQPYGELKDADDETYFPITISDLANVEIGTSVSNGVLTKTIDNDELEGKKITQTDKKGWYISFPENGEKVLAPSITFEGSIIFTTLVPKVLTTGELISACAAPATQGRLYALDILEAEATIDQDQNEVIDNNDVFNTISASEIPGTPQQVFNKLECDGDECKHEVDIRIGKKSTEVGSANVAKLESIYWGSPEKK